MNPTAPDPATAAAEPAPASDRPHPFDDAVALDRDDAGTIVGRTTPAYGNMVGPFGGITAAVMLAAVAGDPRRIGEVIALTVNFAGPLADGAFTLAADAVRTNRTTQHWNVVQRQGDAIATTASAVFALRRDTWSAGELARPDVPPACDVPVTPSPMRVAWSSRYEMRFIAGGWPDFTAPQDVADSHTALWISDDPPRPLDAMSLAAICDAFYPRIFRRRQRFTPAGTVSVTTYFHADASMLAAQGSRPVLGRARALRFSRGFFDQSAEVWSDDGHLLASSHQVVYYKE